MARKNQQADKPNKTQVVAAATETSAERDLVEDVTSSRNNSLDSLRGIFAMVVVFSHIELVSSYFGLSDAILHPVLFQAGRIAVSGFFCLSGFLITLHLLKLKRDRNVSGGKQLGRFYLKRILRIWPLYYLVIALSIFVFPHIPALHFKLWSVLPNALDALDKWQWWYWGLMPQFPISRNVVLPFAEPTWSIGVEEIFYVFIPLFILFTKCRKWILVLIGLSFVFLKFYLDTKLPENPMPGSLNAHDQGLFNIFNFMTYNRFECILTGVVTALLFDERNKFVYQLRAWHVLIALLILAVAIGAVTMHTFIYLQFSIPMAIIIAWAALNKGSFLNNKILAFIGKISFSLYLTHEIAIVLLLNNKTIADITESNRALLFVFAFILAFVIATISYKLIEEPFIKLKQLIERRERKNAGKDDELIAAG